jgi:hypothetical protein
MAFNLDKVIAGMSFGIPSREVVEEAIGMLLSYPATREGDAQLSVYSYGLQTSWPRLYHDALLLLQRNKASDDLDASIAARRSKKRKYDSNRRESIAVADVFSGHRDQDLGIDLKGRVRLVGSIRPRVRVSLPDMVNAVVHLPPVVVRVGADAVQSITDEDSSSD